MSTKLLNKTNSLFFKIFLSFLLIILILTAITLVLFGIFRNSVKDEIVNFNKLNLEHTITNYDKQLQITNNLMLTMYYDNKVASVYHQLQRYNKQSVDYLLVNEIWNSIKMNTNNPLLYIDNIAIYYKPFSFTLGKDGSYSAFDFFSSYTQSKEYPFSFYEDRLSEHHRFTILPASDFSNAYETTKKLIPIILRIQPNDYLIISYLDASKLYQTLHPSLDGQFYMFSESGELIYSSSEKVPSLDITEHLVKLSETSYIKSEDHYYFFKQSGTTGVFYVNEIPLNKISERISWLNHVVSLILVLALTLSIIVALWMTRRLNRPLHQIIQALIHKQSPDNINSNVTEFHLIQDKIARIFTEMDSLQFNIKEKDLLLTNYNYINRMKRIHSKQTAVSHEEAGDDIVKLILFKFVFKENIDEHPIEKKAYFIKEYIDLYFSEIYVQSRTFQMEPDQILTVLFGKTEEANLIHELNHLKVVFDQDVEHYIVTICVSETYEFPHHFEKAYSQTLSMLEQRALLKETQLFFHDSKQVDKPLYSDYDLQILFNHLQEGNFIESRSKLEDLFDQLNKKNAPSLQFTLLAEQILNKRNEIDSKIDPKTERDRDKLSRAVEQCFSYNELLAYIGEQLQSICIKIEDNKQKKDDILDFVLDYVENHYHHQDISLELIADKIKLSTGYLSNYIKQKTEINFIDHLVNTRIEKASELLTQTNLPISRIAEKVGYYNVTSFNRVFKKITGLSPGEYRKKRLGS